MTRFDAIYALESVSLNQAFVELQDLLKEAEYPFRFFKEQVYSIPHIIRETPIEEIDNYISRDNWKKYDKIIAFTIMNRFEISVYDIVNYGIEFEKHGFERCYLCDLPIRYSSDSTLHNGGEIQFHFGYGSDHDQLGAGHGVHRENNGTRHRVMSNLGECDSVVAYICDFCYSDNCHKCKGYRVPPPERPKRIRVV